MFNILIPDELKAVQELKEMDKWSSNGLQGLINSVKHAHNAFWNGEVSPQVKIQLLGTNAQSVFQALEATENLIHALKPDYVKLGVPEGFEIMWNTDGSGTINVV